ncbi:MAG TPA: cyclic pyranopterin monophosphate synthase MoaC [Clostridia bacterium]|nr:cyclic pyranopterin monophosphate synthase MoaC [Clostridia bacterium]
MSGLTHFDSDGRARMVDVGDKKKTRRVAVARGEIRMQKETFELIAEKGAPKGDVLGVARIAGVMAAKNTPSLIPLCHHIAMSGVEISFMLDNIENKIEIEAATRAADRTGVEMEALTAVSVAALTIYDMCKAIDRAMVIGEIRLVHKSGGKSGVFNRDEG